MGAPELLTALEARGLRVSREGGALWVGPTGLLTDEDRAAIAVHKPALLDLLDHRCSRQTIDVHAHHAKGAMSIYGEEPRSSSIPVKHEQRDRGDQTAVVDADTLEEHLRILYRNIRRGCRAGLHAHLTRVPAEIVRALVAACDAGADPQTSAAVWARAGDTTALAAAIDEYRYQLRLLRDLDPKKAFKHAAALDLCLVHEARRP